MAGRSKRAFLSEPAFLRPGLPLRTGQGGSKLDYRLTVTDRAHGFFEIEGMPKTLLDEFSKRREQVIERVTELKASGEAGLKASPWRAF